MSTMRGAAKRVWRAARNLWWRAAGARALTVFGHRLRVDPHAELPYDAVLRLPEAGPTSGIVRYADFVQMHAVAHGLSQLTEPAVVVDVGAHHGAYALLAGKLVQGAGGRVLALEPHPESFDMLCKNVRLSGLERTVHCVQAAVSDAPGPVRIDPCGSETRIGVPDGDGVSVEAVTLDRLLADHDVRHVDLLIVDVEGAELPVLRSFPWARVTLGQAFCELHPYAWPEFGYDGDDLQRFLHAQGYCCLDMYMQEHDRFDGDTYIGPSLLLRTNARNP
jgi:FkbM family methyltransferase